MYLRRASDTPLIDEYKAKYLAMNHQELIDEYNGIPKLYGAHGQMIGIYVLHSVFLLRFNKTPFIVESNCVYTLAGKIRPVGDSWEYIEDQVSDPHDAKQNANHSTQQSQK